MKPDYDKTIPIGENILRVVVEHGLVRVYHNDEEVASRRGDVGLLIFQVMEAEQPVMYDIAVLQSGYVRMFVGRNGLLVYSDDPAVKPYGPVGE